MTDYEVIAHPQALNFLNLNSIDQGVFIERLLSEHEMNKARNQHLLKNSPESAVSLVALDPFPPLCVKEFKRRNVTHQLKSFFRDTQAVRSFKNGSRLIEAGFPPAKPLFLVRQLKYSLPISEWLIMEAPQNALELDRFLVNLLQENCADDQKIDLSTAFGHFMGRLHAARIFHSDLKSCNIMVIRTKKSDRTDISFQLLDYDDVVFGKLSEKNRLKNLMQLFLSLPRALGPTWRLQFMRTYSVAADISRNHEQKIVKELLELCSGKQILYVGFNGDVREEWP